MTVTKPRIHIIGAGFSGLTVAYLLARSKMFDMTIYEKDAKVGGMIGSIIKDGILVESGANSILCTQETLDFLNEIGVNAIFPLPTAKKRFFFRDELTRWPLTILETLAFIPRVLFHLITQKSFLKFNSQETVWAWSEKYFGPAFTKYMMSPALQGVYATTADHLNAQNILGHILQPRKERFKGIVSGTKGMNDIIQSLEQKCIDLDVKILTNHVYDFSVPGDIVIIATSAKDAARTVMLQYKFLGAELEKIKMNHVISVTCKVDKSDRPQGFGALISENTATKCLGVLFNSDIFAHRSSDGYSSETYIFSNQESETINSLPPDELKEYMQKTRQAIFKTHTPIQKIYTSYWPNGLPIYDHVLANFQNNFVTPENNLYLHGNYVAGIGLSKIIQNSYLISNTILKAHT